MTIGHYVVAVLAMQPDASAPQTAVPSAADLARLACRIDLARESASRPSSSQQVSAC